MVENWETRGAAGLLEDLRELRATSEGLETAGVRRDCRVRGALEVSRLNAEQEADIMVNIT